ncbi:lytic transglycosylase domain-containing protein, partial [Beijerinckia sp. L45]|uniref:lytic transglycosylase domain-containing protein n=1 Tax=Beijerinckia sp. L45 TaxID=1641855 RepID=UPI00131BE338
MFRFTACAVALLAFSATVRASEPPHSAELDDMIVRQAKRHGVPEKLVRRIVMRESKYNPRARNHSFWGLMQISYPTARSMGFKGSPSELLDPLVNLTYAVPYLANAFVIAGKQEDAAVRLYASGYYATAKNRNLLDQLRTADSAPVV